MSKKQKHDSVAQSHIKTSIGGQALIEGIMMRGPKRTAMAVRNPAGEIVLEEWETVGTKRSRVFRFPFIRGIFNFVDSMRFGYKCLMRSAEISGFEQEAECSAENAGAVTPEVPAEVTETSEMAETASVEMSAEPVETAGGTTESPTAAADEPSDEKKEEKKSDGKGSSVAMGAMMVISTLLGFALAIALFIWLPAQIYAWLPDRIFSPDNRYLKSAFEGVCKIVLLIAYMSLISLMKDIRRTFMFHGAEHKTIFCYEAGLELTVDNIRRMPRFHPRCGTSFLILMVLVSIIIGFFIPPMWATPIRVLVKLLLIPVTVGVGYELIKFAGRHDNVLTKIISAPGLWLQHLTVFEPEDDMIECAIAAMERVIPDDKSDRW